MKKTHCIPLIAAALAALLSLYSQAAEAAKPNIILIVADDLGYGDLGCYGSEEIQTPHIDRLAASGIRLTDGYVSHPYCGPSRAGLMTGRYQQRFGFRFNPAHQRYNRRLGLDVEEEILGELLARAGYNAGAFGKWHLGSATRFHPNSRGFDQFFGFASGGREYFPSMYSGLMRKWINNPEPPVPALYAYAEPLEMNGVMVPPPDGYLTDILTTQTLGFIRRVHKDFPFFVYLAYNAPHTPLQAPEETIAKYAGIADKIRRIYAAMVDNLDHNVGRILDELEHCGIRGNTLVVFLSDNGGLTSHGANNGPLRGGKSQTYEGGVRVPFIWSWPGGLPEGREVSTPISSLDLLPTFAEVAGVEPRGKLLDGVNVLPWLQGTADGRPHEQLCWLSHDRKQAIRLGDLKATRTGELPWQLYDLSADLGEEIDLAAKMPEKTAALAATYRSWLSEMPPARWPDPGKGNMVPLPSGKDLIKQFK